MVQLLTEDPEGLCWPQLVMLCDVLCMQVAQMLLQQQRRWQELGYVRGAGGGSAASAEAMLLLFNSQVAALAGDGWS